MAKMRVQGSRVIISGHETTKEECNAVTLMCDEMAKSKDFRLVEYRPGYAEFEAVGQAEDLKFVPEPSSITMNFDSGITSVEMSGDAELTWTQSGTNLSFNGTGLGSYTFTVICADGKVLDSVDLSSLYSYTNYTRDSENVFSLTGDTTPSGEITLTSKVAPSVPTPDWANSFVKVGSTMTCEQCGGSGTYSWTETGTLSEPCTSCAGSGMMGAEMCGACGGSGSMTVETVIEHNDPCPNCQATGVISTSENKAVEKVWIKQNGQLVQIFGEQSIAKNYAFQWNSSSSNWWNNYLHLVLNGTDYNKPPKTFPDLTSGVTTPIKLWDEDDESSPGQGRFALYDSSGQLITPIEFVGANCDSEGYFYLPSYLGEINGTITPPYYENGATVIFEYK